MYIEGCNREWKPGKTSKKKKKKKKKSSERCMLSLRGGGVRRGYLGVELGFRILACNLILTRDAQSLKIGILGCPKKK